MLMLENVIYTIEPIENADKSLHFKTVGVHNDDPMLSWGRVYGQVFSSDYLVYPGYWDDK